MSQPGSPWILRVFDADRDADAVSRLDTSIVSDRGYRVRRDGADALRLELAPLAAPIRKRLPIDLAADAWTDARVVELDGAVRGFVAWGIAAWNRRATIHHFYVDAPVRGRGAGRLLMSAALAEARRAAARTAWVETPAVNHPAIAAYRRLGFDVCGFDTTLYRGTDGEGEVAVYLAHLLA